MNDNRTTARNLNETDLHSRLDAVRRLDFDGLLDLRSEALLGGFTRTAQACRFELADRGLHLDGAA